MYARIKIISKNAPLLIVADGENNIFTLNGKTIKEQNVDAFLSRLGLICLDWEESRVNDMIFDATRYEISFSSGVKTKNFTVRGTYPKNFDKFLRLLNEVTHEKNN